MDAEMIQRDIETAINYAMTHSGWYVVGLLRGRHAFGRAVNSGDHGKDVARSHFPGSFQRVDIAVILGPFGKPWMYADFTVASNRLRWMDCHPHSKAKAK